MDSLANRHITYYQLPFNNGSRSHLGMSRLYAVFAHVELREKFDRLQGDYDRVREGNARLSDRLQEVKLENKALRQVSADYERVKRVFGPEQVEVAVQADKQREQAEKGRKRPRRSLGQGGDK